MDEPRAGLRRGHISAAKNVPFQDLIDPLTQTYKPERELAQIFHAKGIDTTVTTVSYCGSGLTACVNDLALRLLGNDKTVLYDGSWSEYVRICANDIGS